MEQLRMSRYSLLRDGTVVEEKMPPFTVMLNPSELKRGFSINYNKVSPFRSSAKDRKLSYVGNETLSFSLVIDGTGAVPAQSSGNTGDVTTQLKELHGVVYVAPGASAEISRVRIVWGKFGFHGRLETMSVNYVLFAPDGAALRAKVDLAFVSAQSTKEAELDAAVTTPGTDGRTVTTRQGDTLARLCELVYGDAAYVGEVARANSLGSLRTLKPGTELTFPPLAAA